MELQTTLTIATCVIAFTGLVNVCILIWATLSANRQTKIIEEHKEAMILQTNKSQILVENIAKLIKTVVEVSNVQVGSIFLEKFSKQKPNHPKPEVIFKAIEEWKNGNFSRYDFDRQ